MTECGCAGELVRTLPCREIWVPTRVPAVEGLFFFASPERRTSGERRIGAVQMQYRGGKDAAVYLTAHGRTMLLLFSPGCDLSRLPRSWTQADIVYARSALPSDMRADRIGLVLLSRSAAQGEPAIRMSGTLAASTAGNGDLRLRIDPDGAVGLEQ